MKAFWKIFWKLVWEDLVPGKEEAARVYLVSGIIYGVTALLMSSPNPFYMFASGSITSLVLAGLNYYSADYQRRHGRSE